MTGRWAPPGCRVSEIAFIRWKEIAAIDDGAQIHLFGKGSKQRTVRVSTATLGLFQGLGFGSDEEFFFPSPRQDGHLPKSRGGPGYGKNAANDAAYWLCSLISRLNPQLDAPQERVALPDIDAIPITQKVRKQLHL